MIDYTTKNSNKITKDYHNAKFSFMGLLGEDKLDLLSKSDTAELLKTSIFASLRAYDVAKSAANSVIPTTATTATPANNAGDKQAATAACRYALLEAGMVGKLLLKMTYNFQSSDKTVEAIVDVLMMLCQYKGFGSDVLTIRYLYALMIFAFFCAADPNASYQQQKQLRQVSQMDEPAEMEHVTNTLNLSNAIYQKAKQCKKYIYV